MAQPYFRKTTLALSASALAIGGTATATITLCNRCGQKVPASARISVRDANGTLSFGPLSPDGSGVYTCTVTATAAGTSLIVVTLGRDSKTFDAPAIVVTASAPPVAAVSVSPPGGTAGLQSFTVTSSASGGTAPYTYAVDFGDGEAGSGSSLTHTYATPGTKTITLTVTDNAGQTGTASITVDVGAALSATLSLSTNTGTAGSTLFGAIPVAAGGTYPYTYSTNWGDGLTSTGSPTSHAYAAPGTYTVTTTITDAAGSVAVAPSVIVIASPATPALAATLNLSSLTGTATVTSFTATAAGVGGTSPYVHSVNWGDGTTTTGASTSHTYATAGSKTVTLTTTDNVGSIVTRTATITAGAALAANLSLSGSTGTAGSSIFVAVASASGGTAPYSYSIAWGDGATSTGSTGTHVYAAAGSYTATLTVTDAAGSTSTHTRAVTIAASGGGGASGGVTPSWSSYTLNASDRKVYVSSSTGSNSNDGLTPETPKLTINGSGGGLSLMRTDRGDWLCLKAGDVFAEAINWETRGRSTAYPTILTSYGSGAKPSIRPPAGSSGWEAVNNGAAFVAIIGIDFYNVSRDPGVGTPSNAASTGVRWYGQGDTLLIEDCSIRFFTNGVNLLGVDATHYLANPTLRGCVITDNYHTPSAHGEGIYATWCSAITIEDCVFDHNGWNETAASAERDVFSHNIYIDNENVGTAHVVRRNILARGASHGIQLRCGGTVSDNLALRNAIGILIGGGDGYASSSPGGVPVTCANNVITESDDIGSGGPRGYGFDLVNISGGTVTGNIVTQDASAAAYGHGFSIDQPTAALAVASNIVWNWHTPYTADAAAAVTLTGNYFGNYGGPNTPGYVDPNRTVGRYAGEVLSLTATNAGFLTAARAQSKAAWNAALSAPAVNAWIRAGFSTAAVAAPVPTSISINGTSLAINVGSTVVCNGPILLRDVPTLWPTTPARPAVENPADGVTYSVGYTVAGDTVTCVLNVTNNHPTLDLPWLSIQLPDLPFCPAAQPGADFDRVEAIATSWHDNTWSIAHPTTRQPFGAWRIATTGAGAIGWGFNPVGEDETPKNLIRTAGIPQTRPLFFIQKPVAAAGGTATVTFAIRVSTNTAKTYLWETYKASHAAEYDETFYTASWAPVAAAYAMTQAGLVNGGNPYGYKTANDMTGEHATTYVLDTIAAVKALGCQSLILWDPSGFETPMLNPNFARTRIAAAAAEACSAAAPMSMGIGARMGAVVDPASAGGVRARTTGEVAAIVTEWDRAAGWGFDHYYGDEMGTRQGDLAIVKAVRARQVLAGSTAAGFVERLVDVMAAYVGGYTNVYVSGSTITMGPQSGPGLDAEDVAVMHWLHPGLPFVVQIHGTALTDAQLEAAFRFSVSNGAIPIIPWFDAARQVPIYEAVLEDLSPADF